MQRLTARIANFSPNQQVLMVGKLVSLVVDGRPIPLESRGDRLAGDGHP
jgi:hypothetical protein